MRSWRVVLDAAICQVKQPRDWPDVMVEGQQLAAALQDFQDEGKYSWEQFEAAVADENAVRLLCLTPTATLMLRSGLVRAAGWQRQMGIKLGPAAGVVRYLRGPLGR